LPFDSPVCIMVGMKFDKIVFISIIVQLLGAPFVFSQEAPAKSAPTSEEVNKVKADLDAHYEAWAEERRKSYSPQWDGRVSEMTLRANALAVENERLANEQESLLKEWREIDSQLEQKKSANQALQAEIDRKRNLSEDRHWKEHAGDELKQWQKKSDEKTKELADIDRQLSAMDKKTQLGKLKLMSLGVDVGPIETRLKGEEEVERLHSQLAAADDRERVLKYKLDGLKPAQIADPQVLALKNEIDALNAKIAEAQNSAGKDPGPKADDRETLKRKKQDLQAEVERLKAPWARSKMSRPWALPTSASRPWSMKCRRSILRTISLRTRSGRSKRTSRSSRAMSRNWNIRRILSTP
jgi:chromosome segregation ATPase